MNENLDKVIENICNQKIKGRKLNKQPLCILVGGLPGSGKTNLVKKIQDEYKQRDFVVIDTDDYRKLHPDYESLLKTPEKAISETSEFSNAIESELIKRSIESHCDIISVTTLRATELINQIIYEPVVRVGYKVECCIMAVPISICGLSAQIRYEAQITKGECPRFTPMNFIETSFKGIMDTIQMLQNKEDDVIIKIYKRGQGENSMPIEFYNSKNKNYQYRSALEAFNNPSNNMNNEVAIQQINKLYQLKKLRNSNSIEYASLERLKELFATQNERE